MGKDNALDDQRSLLRRIAEGDIAAFRMLFDAYNARLYGSALKITKSPYAAEEIVQEIFACIWEHRSHLGEVDNPPAYIFTVAYNQSFRHLKKVAADSKLYQSLLSRAMPGHNETEEWLDLKETEKLINHAVEELPRQRKLIYKLSREKGLTHQQIAQRLNISPLTVKKQIVLALRNIRNGLADVAPMLAFFLFFY